MNLGEAAVGMTSVVAFPQAVLDALTEGRLVFFVGAGASVDGPSNLPLFNELARQLAELARVRFDERVAIDFFLGSMPANFDVHARTRDLIAHDHSKPNSTHTALVRLASAKGPLRIVTTNFDDHLKSAADADGIQIEDKWIGPALPLGNDFTGIVHLHGSVLRDARGLVVTDGDFGRAYLTDAWATRFLLPMFQKFTVLFIGYSHDDPIMRYLALGLPSGTPRYALTDAANAADPKWARLGVQVIDYPVQDGNHRALVAALEAWDTRVRMGQLEHHARMKEIIDAGTTLTPVDRDYLLDRLQAADGARQFAQTTASIEPTRQLQWLRWVETQPKFQELFTGGEVSAASTILGSWFGREFVTEPKLHGAALQTVQRLGQTFNDGFFHALGWAAEQLSASDSVAGQRWKAFLATSVYGCSAPVTTKTLLPHLLGDRSEHVAVLRAGLRPLLVLKRRWFLGTADETMVFPDAEVRWGADAETLTRHVLQAVEAAKPGDVALGALLEDSLNGAYELLDAYHGKQEWDGLSYGRSAIEPHDQDQFRDPVDAVIDGLRAYGAKALSVHAKLPERWWSIGRSLFQRLALHLLTADETRTADEKIEWLLERPLLYEHDLKHEVYGVLQAATGAASDGLRARLLEAAHKGPHVSDELSERDRHIAYAIYNLLVWLARVAPEWDEVGTALKAAQVANPGFAPREHPDFDRWMTSGTWGRKLPMEPEDFIHSFQKNPSRALDDLLERDYSERNFGEPTWHDALDLIRQAAERCPDAGDHLWELLGARTDLDARADDLCRAIIDGWAKANLGETAGVAVRRVRSQAMDNESAHNVSTFLRKQVCAQIESDETPTLVAMRQIARDLWREQRESFSHSEGADTTSFAPLYLNSWPGDLAEYWMSEIDRRWRKHRDDWSGLNTEERDALIELLNGPPHTLDATQPALASQLFFMFEADPEFTTKHILPLFRSDETATLAWGPYLHQPRYNDRLLAAGLLDSVLVEWSRLNTLGDRRLEDVFLHLVASMVSFAGIDSESRQSLLDASVLADDGAHAAAFAETVVHLLSEPEVNGGEIWDQWLREHLIARLRGVPRNADVEELACWADTVPYLGDRIPEALEILNKREIPLSDQFFTPNFSEGILPAHGPALVQHYAERSRRSSPSSYRVRHQVRKTIETIQVGMGDAAAQPLVDAAEQAGLLGDGMA